MTDRELLERAARAAGLDLEWCGPWACMARNLGVIDGFDRHTCWDSLKDDGDALRLRNTLQMTLIDEGDKVYAEVTHFQSGTIVREPYERDLPGGFASQASVDAATRRAITRAAAEIGKDMP